MSVSSLIDLSRLPSPDLVQALDYEQILRELKSELGTKDEAIVNALALESEPLVQLLETFAYREMILRAYINDSARQCMLAFASGSNLDNLGVLYGVERGVVQERDSSASPPIEEIKESDEDFRKRIRLAPEGLSVAGSGAAYVYQALSLGNEPSYVKVESSAANEIRVTYRFENDDPVGKIKDAATYSPAPGEVAVVLLGREGNGTLDKTVIGKVQAHLQGDTVRPLTDNVRVLGAEIVNYSVKARLYLYEGPDVEVVSERAKEMLKSYAEERHVLGGKVTVSGIHAALQIAGVSHVELEKLEELKKLNLSETSIQSAPYLQAMDVTFEVLERATGESTGPSFDKELITTNVDETSIRDGKNRERLYVNGLNHARKEEMVVYLTGEDAEFLTVDPQTYKPNDATTPREDRTTLQVVFTGEIDYESKKQYDFTLNAVDKRGAKASQRWLITVNDIPKSDGDKT